jgi:hypothetical protein
MNALLLLSRAMAWTGEYWRSLKVIEEKGIGGWQDKTGAVGVGGDVRLSKLSCASHQIARLARFSRIGVIWPFTEPLQGQS